jgi:hypothetical protein
LPYLRLRVERLKKRVMGGRVEGKKGGKKV